MKHISLSGAGPLVQQRRSLKTSVPTVLGLLLAIVVVWASPAAGSVSASRELSGPQLAAAKQCPWPACSKVIAAVSAGTRVKQLPGNLSPSLESASKDLLPPKGFLGCVVNQTGVSTPFPCVINPTATDKRMALIGDSHAEMWSSPLAQVAKADGYSLLFLAKIPCPLPMVPFWNVLNNTPDTQCTTWKKWATAKIQQFDPSVVVATTEDLNPYTNNALAMSQKTFSSGLVTTLKGLAAPGRRVILLGDIPYLSRSGPVCLAAHESSVSSCATPVSQAVNKQKQAAEQSAAAKAGATFVDVIPWFCTTKSCPATIDNLDVYSDGEHITATYGDSLADVLTQSLGLGPAASGVTTTTAAVSPTT
jgi:SGNH domain (fused to AT3 domains)